MSTVGDRLWIWAHNVGAHDPDTQWKLPRASRMTPLEGAVYMGLRNMQMIWLWRPERPEPTPSWRQYALPMRAMDQVVWSIAGGHGLSFTDHVFPLVAGEPNVTGVIMDDFFTPRAGGHFAALDEAELADVRRRLELADRRLDLWCVVYEQDLAKPIAPVLAEMDVLCFFVWNSPNLPGLAAHVDELDTLAPGKRRVLGLYMWDYAARKPMPIETMETQCATALELLRAGRIEGVTFVASCICDLELETVEWTRDWIRRVSPEELPA